MIHGHKKKKYRFKFNKNNFPLYISAFVFFIVLVLWLFPSAFSLISETYDIAQFRSDLKDLAGLFYIFITLWLVLVTRDMAQVSMKAQKAMNQPEVICEMFITDLVPNAEFFSGVNNIEILNTPEAEYINEQSGASIFVIVKNLEGSGKAINIAINAEFKAKNPEDINLERKFSMPFLADSHAFACYIYNFSMPSVEKCTLNLKKCELTYSDPFSEALNSPIKKINYDIDYPIATMGNHRGSIKLKEGFISY